MKKIYQTKTFRVKTDLENHFQIAIVTADHNPPIKKVFAEDHQVNKIHKIVHKIDVADQKVKTISIETIALDQTQIEIFIQTIIGTVVTQILGIDTILMTVQEILQAL